MKRLLALLGICLAVAACAAEPKAMVPQVTFISQTDVDLIRFEIDDYDLPPTPAELNDANVQRQFVSRARIYAEQYIKQMSLCPGGFSGPDAVFAKRQNRMRSQFVIRCLK